MATGAKADIHIVGYPKIELHILILNVMGNL
jgi:hypothetical protein